MKTSIFDMNFTLPPVVVMTEVVKDMPMGTYLWPCLSGIFTEC
jgi:hypothetical protein